MDTDLLRAFLETAEAGALSRAARRLGFSQPSLTGQIQRLESHLGVVLFRRHGRGVALTEAGEALVPRARRLLDEMRAMEATIRGDGAADDDVRGSVRVGVIPTIAPYVMPEALRRFRGRHGAARVELREDYSAALADQLHEGALDVVIAAQPMRSTPSMSSRWVPTPWWWRYRRPTPPRAPVGSRLPNSASRRRSRWTRCIVWARR